MAVLSFDNVVFSTFAFHASVCLIKTLGMGLWTSALRISKNVYLYAEDCKSADNTGKLKPRTDNSVERVRGNHRNDLENIVPFVLVGALYCLSGPTASTAIMHFRIYTATRLFHMLAYQIPLPQPCRALAHAAGVTIVGSMAIQVLRVTTW